MEVFEEEVEEVWEDGVEVMRSESLGGLDMASVERELENDKEFGVLREVGEGQIEGEIEGVVEVVVVVNPECCIADLRENLLV